MSKKKTQKVLIPKGTINPDEDTLIEIPVALKDQPVVVAKKTDNSPRNVTYINTSQNVKTSRSVALEEEPVFISRSRTSNKDQQRRSDFSPSYNSTVYETAYINTESNPSFGNLDETEVEEKRIIQKKLEDFQQARRQLIIETGIVATKSNQFIPHTNLGNVTTSSTTNTTSSMSGPYSQAMSTPYTPPRSKSSIQQSRGIKDDDDGDDYTPDPPTKKKTDADVVFGLTANKSRTKPIINSDEDIIVSKSPKKSANPPTKTPENDSHEAVQSIYIRHSSSCPKRPLPQDSCIIAHQNNAATSHRRYEKSRSSQYKQVQTDSHAYDDEEEEDCVCLSRSTQSLSRSAHSVSRSRHSLSKSANCYSKRTY